MQLSYWETKTWLTDIDYTIIGSGIVGLNCALQLREKYPTAKILVLEKGVLPNGASTKNAGFACFGSISELLDDLKTHSEEEVLQLVYKRNHGLQILRNTLGDTAIEYRSYGGYELFTHNDESLYEECQSKLSYINTLLKEIFKEDVFSVTDNVFGFKNIQPSYIYNKFEGQINTGSMMRALLKKAHEAHILLLTSSSVSHYQESQEHVSVYTPNFEFKTKKLCIATNGFASSFDIPNVKPARAQVIISKPIPNLKIKGTFHLDKGYYYFRNIDNRILLGGGRNLDFKGEETTNMEVTSTIINALSELLHHTILPEYTTEIAHSWSGIMGVGDQKKSIVHPLSDRVYCGVRLGGMGVAIGSLVGKELADLI
ncbi:NAD(P)/FAD-dependent oxidoreductase [Aquimarina hainanensis]|uniref:NAD(P)/FAD-dependent oxidoreductase n=1 Tax=Aquimarina hainanensis TaxID=1578017 RepID=A0ABW5N2K7_9FLAO|nr:FAD-dependent oxidoreductase [Aquimarina sp. TRL1]QKX04584.1 FAD-binding oxidoreductase [Aquimarina sp. TRL1]